MLLPGALAAQTATVDIPDLNATVMDQTRLLLGLTFDCRSGMTGGPQYGQVGYHGTNGAFMPEIDALFYDMPMPTVRYPANGVMVGFDWKGSIGPLGQRTSQNLLGGLGQAQSMVFGFDEFMALTEARGMTGADVQIMVQIYDDATVGLTTTQAMAALPNVVQHNADWVEYCNAPNDGSNPGGGTDWAAVRAANGHAAPYGVRIWNMGNEPWTQNEYGSTAANYAAYEADITPMVNAMLAIDPTIHITLPISGQPGNTGSWSNALLNGNLVAQGKVYGVSQHYFPTENQVNGNAPTQGISAVSNHFSNVASAAAAKGLKAFLGDYAHGIPNTQSTAQQDLAMQWQGADLMADMLVMLSQTPNVERCNFWTYGMPYATWHPIRINAIGDYTLMPAAQLHKLLMPALLDRSVQVSATSPAGTDGNPYAVRSGAFVSNDLSQLSIVAVNRDRNATVPLSVSGTNGYQLSGAQLLTGATLDADVIDVAALAADGQGLYQLPPMSVAMLSFAASAVGIDEASGPKLTVSPNPTSGQLRLNLPCAWAEVTDLNGRVLMRQEGKVDRLDCSHLPSGLYLLRTDVGHVRIARQ
jgi:alpha-L-arabinofuranosidase